MKKISYFLNNLLSKGAKIKSRLLLPKFKQIGENFQVDYPFNIVGAENIQIGTNFVARKNLKLRAFVSFHEQRFTPTIEIGNNVSIETDCHIGCIDKISIGNGVLIASGVYISDHSHGSLNYDDVEIPPLKRVLSSKGPVIIDNNVWIGERAVILAGITIGQCSIIGANAVVTKDIPPYSIVAGVPAKILKTIPY
jgi:acetyltransferase-like isoleucine patch superfamily enzyme